MAAGAYGNNLLEVWQFILKFYRENRDICKCPYKILKLSMFSSGSGGYPKLKGKAAEVRDLGPPLLALWRVGMLATDVFHVAILSALEASCRMDAILRHNKACYCLPEGASQEFMEQARVYVQNQANVHNHGGDRLFNLTLKHHQILHCAHNAKYINPRLTWCFMGEDFMKLTKKVAVPTQKARNTKMCTRRFCGGFSA